MRQPYPAPPEGQKELGPLDTFFHFYAHAEKRDWIVQIGFWVLVAPAFALLSNTIFWAFPSLNDDPTSPLLLPRDITNLEIYLLPQLAKTIGPPAVLYWLLRHAGYHGLVIAACIAGGGAMVQAMGKEISIYSVTSPLIGAGTYIITVAGWLALMLFVMRPWRDEGS